MTKDEAVRFYGTQGGLAEALGIAQSSVAEWGEYPPALRQVQIEMLTRKKLRAERDVYPQKRKETA